ncbi:MAG: response regulator [Acetatifactor sp.]
MREHEKEKATHLLILVVYTIFALILAGEAYLMKWEAGPVLLLFLGIIACWVIYILEKVPISIQLWLDVTLTMLAVFYYGSHESSMYDLAPFIIMVIILYSITEKISMIRFCMATYCFTMLYDFLFVVKLSMEMDLLLFSRTLLHFGLVFVSGYLVEMIIRRQNQKKNEMNQVIRELEETNRRTEDFLTNVSHELRTPINVVTGITTIMLKNEEEEEKRRNIHSVQKAGHRLFDQIEDILDFTEIDTGRVMVSEESYMISSVINDIIIGNQLAERENTLELIFDVDPGIPSILVGDVKKIKKIIGHLLDNAYKFTREGGICVRITTLPKPYGVNLCIRVTDTGIGMDKAELDRIKRHFYQSSAGRNRKVGGLGLGLSIIYGMVNAMEGFIQIHSEKGKGTEVSVSIPQKVANETCSMTVERKETLSIGCFLLPEKYPVPEVRVFYDGAISHLAEGLDLKLHRVYDREGLEKLVSHYSLTHLFVGWEEYQENEMYLEVLTEQMEVVVIAGEAFDLPAGSRAKLIRKPFYAFPIINCFHTAASGKENVGEQSMSLPGVRVLVVDDEPMNLMVAEGIFKNYRMSVTLADSGKKAIELCKNREFDLIFLDHMMPEMDGVETIRHIREISADTGRQFRVIAFTANAVSGAREMFLENGFDEFLSKPIEINELERILKKILPKNLQHPVSGEILPKEKLSVKERLPAEKTPAEKTLAEERRDVILLLQENGLNTRNGLQYSGNDREFYLQLVKKFAQDHSAISGELEEYLQKEACENYKIRVHALKSSAKLIGADLLSELALKLENAAGKADLAYLKENHSRLSATYDTLCQMISQILGKETSEGKTEYTEIPKEELCEKVRSLREILKIFELDRAEEVLAALYPITYRGKTGRELFSGIHASVEDFEFEEALHKADALLAALEGGDGNEA